MVSATLTWHGVTKSFFVSSSGIKVDAQIYLRHLKRYFFAIKNQFPLDDWIYIQDGAIWIFFIIYFSFYGPDQSDHFVIWRQTHKQLKNDTFQNEFILYEANDQNVMKTG